LTERDRIPEALLGPLFEASSDSFIVTDAQGMIRHTNIACSHLLGYGREELLGQPIEFLVPARFADHARMLWSGEHGDAFYGELWSTVMGGETWSGTIVNRRKEGSTYHEEQTIAPVVDDTGEITHFIGIKQDVSKRLAAESALMRAREELAARVKQIEALNVRLQQQALRDPLTGLFNRRYFREAVPREFAAAQRRHDPISIAVLDVDRFKLVNDVHGHAMGDEVLLALAQVLSDGVRSSDLICRFGGDEFVIVFPGTTAEVGEARAEALCQAFRSLRFADAHGDALQATISIGVATTGEGDAPIDVLMAQADAALYSAKRGGRDRVVVNREWE
jgi:diguanylate cyclase (GGDEF)-like protein/PAS domain S-box-containing protein